MKKYILTGLILCISCAMFGQSQSQAKKWFAAGEYEKAKPAFAKLIKGNPKNGSLNYWYGVCLNETGEHDKALPYLQKAVEREVENAFRYIGDYYMQDGDYEQAIENYEIYLERVDPEDQRFVEYTRKLEQANREFKYIKRVEKVTIVDSIVLPKNQFLKAYTIGRESGSIHSTPDLIREAKTTEGFAYRTEMHDKVYYSDVDENGKLQINMRYKMLDDWSKPMPLEGFPEGDNNYPFLMSDGITMYFANNSLEGLGGYDIFITRFNSGTNRYLLPENVGMPFNSTANDYMMAIDEINGIGWFATDRNQPDSLVCVYTFVPNETKQYYNYASDNHLDILRAAHIYSIAATQTDEEVVRKAEQALFMLSLNNSEDDKEDSFTFVIDDFVDYHQANDFKCPEARQLFNDWLSKSASLTKLSRQLDDCRIKYSQSTAAERQAMSEELLRMEKQHELMETEVNDMVRAIRNTEINFHSGKQTAQ